MDSPPISLSTKAVLVYRTSVINGVIGVMLSVQDSAHAPLLTLVLLLLTPSFGLSLEASQMVPATHPLHGTMLTAAWRKLSTFVLLSVSDICPVILPLMHLKQAHGSSRTLSVWLRMPILPCKPTSCCHVLCCCHH